MTEPMYAKAFEDLWDNQVPQIYKVKDAELGWPLKRWFAGIGGIYAQISDLANRMLYVPPNERHLLHVDPPPTGQMLRSVDDVRVMTNGGTWSTAEGPRTTPEWIGDDFTATYRILDTFDDGAYVQWTPYLDGGTWDLRFDYLKKANNGSATVSINGEDVMTVPEGSGTWTSGTVSETTDIDTTAAYRFTVERGYVDIRIRFDTDIQSSGAARMTVGTLYLINQSAGYYYGTSDLSDPRSADDAWLPWLATLFGVVLDKNDPVAIQREQILSATNGFLSGTRQSIINAARKYLTRTRTVRVFDHSVPAGIGTGGIWDVLIVTRTSETPAGIDIPALVTASGAKPAGVVLHHKSYEAAWSALETLRPDWQDWEPDDWTKIEETGLL